MIDVMTILYIYLGLMGLIIVGTITLVWLVITTKPAEKHMHESDSR